MSDAIRTAARSFAKRYWQDELPKYSERFDTEAGDGETTVKIADEAIRFWVSLNDPSRR
jgi:hypothetical protein